VAKVAAVAVRTAGRGHEHLAEEGLVARVADHGAQLLHAVREAAAPGVGARAALPFVAQLCLQGALTVRFHLHLSVLRFLLPSLLPLPITRSRSNTELDKQVSSLHLVC
jgi:hypothetical protein